MKSESLDGCQNECPECGNTILISDESRGETICKKCGLVLNQRIIDSGREWRAFSTEESNKKARTGPLMPQFVLDKGTTIGSGNKDANGNFIDAKTINLINRLRKWNRRTKVSDSKDRNLAYAMEELERVSSQLHLPQKIKEDTALIYKKVVKKDITKGRSIIGMLLACIYISCKQSNAPKTFEEISEIVRIEVKRITNCYSVIFKTLDLENKISSPKNFLPKICSVLNLSSTTEIMALNILKECEKAQIGVGKHPLTTAGAAIYAASLKNGERRTQKEISLATGMCELTIRTQFFAIRDKILSKKL